jgi:hypothetical protein
MQGHFTMSRIELDRLQILQRVAEPRMTQAAAAQALGLSDRQVQRLCAAVALQGAEGLVSRKRGRLSNRRSSDLNTAHCSDFGPTRVC